MENSIVTTVRLEQSLVKELDNLAKTEHTDRTSILKQVLNAGIKEIKIRYALQLYQEGRVSVGKAKELAGVSLWEFLDILKARKIGFRTDEEEFAIQLKEFESR